MRCPGKRQRDCEYAKDGLCDWPYLYGLTLQEVRYLTELLKTILRKVKA